MSLLEDARKLLPIHPLEEEGGARYCRVCGEAIGGYPEWDGHAPECPWLSMPKIIGALEAAERLIAESSPDPMYITTFDNWYRLKRALKGGV